MEDKYFIIINSDPSGPYSKEDLGGLLSDGVITRLTPLKTSGRDSWFTVGEVVPDQGSTGSRPAPPPSPSAVAPQPTSPKLLPTAPQLILVHISRDGQQFGPYKLADVQGYLMTGDLHPSDMAWHEGLPDWITLRSLTSGPQKPLTHASHQTTDSPNNPLSNSTSACGPLESSFRAVLTACGASCYVFAVIDFAGMFFGYDITGVYWSPMVAGFLGTLLVNCSEANRSTS